MNKLVITIIVSTLLSGCYSTANFKSANLIKPHLFPPAADTTATAPLSTVISKPDDFVYFEFNSTQLSTQAQQTLNAHIPAMQAIAKGQIVIQGHTDHVGSETDNHNLAKRRALAVWAYLVNHGVDEARLNPVSLGEEGNDHSITTPALQRHVQLIY